MHRDLFSGNEANSNDSTMTSRSQPVTVAIVKRYLDSLIVDYVIG